MPKFNSLIPGMGLTHKPGADKWQHPPQYSKLSDACDFVFNRLTQPPKLAQILALMKNGCTLETLTRIIVFTGFSEGLWSADLALLLVNPVMFMLGGIAQRAKLNPRLTHIDRSGMRELVHIKSVAQTADPQSTESQQKLTPPSQPQLSKGRGLLAPPGGM